MLAINESPAVAMGGADKYMYAKLSFMLVIFIFRNLLRNTQVYNCVRSTDLHVVDEVLGNKLKSIMSILKTEITSNG